MRVEYDGQVRSSRAIDLSDWEISASAVVAAVRERGDDNEGKIVVQCPAPSPVHDHVGLIQPGMSLRPTAALAAAARSRGLIAPEDEQRRAIEAELADLTVPEIDLTDARRRVAEAGDEVATLRERVATLQGSVQARQEAGLDASAVKEKLADTVQRLSECETDRIAATQRLDRERKQARVARDRHAERLALEDRMANLARTARRRLVATLHEEFVTAVKTVPGPGTVGDKPGSYTGPAETAALAVVRLVEMEAPVVLDCRRFSAAAAATECLGVPVIRL